MIQLGRGQRCPTLQRTPSGEPELSQGPRVQSRRSLHPITSWRDGTSKAGSLQLELTEDWRRAQVWVTKFSPSGAHANKSYCRSLWTGVSCRCCSSEAVRNTVVELTPPNHPQLLPSVSLCAWKTSSLTNLAAACAPRRGCAWGQGRVTVWYVSFSWTITFMVISGNICVLTTLEEEKRQPDISIR